MDLTKSKPIIFTAQSKVFFYCRDAVCQYVFQHDKIPLNPFRVFGYFLGDRVDRDLIRQGNNNLIKIAEELWVFGCPIADGVLFEIILAKKLGKPIRFFTIENRAEDIRETNPTELSFEPGVYQSLNPEEKDFVKFLVGYKT